MEQIHLNEDTLKGMIREAISEYVGEAYGDIRPNTQMMLDYIDDGLVDPKKVLTELLDYVSDDIVGRFMEDNGYTDEYSLEDDEEELDNDTDNEELPAGVTPLEEMDWRTYHSAGCKRITQGFADINTNNPKNGVDKINRGHELLKHATKQYNSTQPEDKQVDSIMNINGGGRTTLGKKGDKIVPVGDWNLDEAIRKAINKVIK